MLARNLICLSKRCSILFIFGESPKIREVLPKVLVAILFEPPLPLEISEKFVDGHDDASNFGISFTYCTSGDARVVRFSMKELVEVRRTAAILAKKVNCIQPLEA